MLCLNFLGFPEFTGLYILFCITSPWLLYTDLSTHQEVYFKSRVDPSESPNNFLMSVIRGVTLSIEFIESFFFSCSNFDANQYNKTTRETCLIEEVRHFCLNEKTMRGDE